MSMNPIDNIEETFGMTDEERAETVARLDSWFGIDPGTGAVDPSVAGDPEAAAQIIAIPPGPTPTPTPPPAPREFQLGDIYVAEQDAPTMAQLYTFLRNNPHRADELKRLMDSPEPPPAWQQQQPETQFQQPQFIPPQYQPQPLPQAYQPPPPYIPPPGQSYTTLPGAGQPPIDLEDPSQRYLYDRMNFLEQQAARANQAQTEWQRVEQQRQAAAQAEAAQLSRRTLIEQNIASGVARFRSAHPDITEEDFGYVTTEASRLNVIEGLSKVMPYDQAVAKALDLAYGSRGGASTPAAASGTTTADAKRKASLSALGSGSSSPGSRTDTPPPSQPRRNDGGPVLDDSDRQAALKMIQQAGIGSLGSALS